MPQDRRSWPKESWGAIQNAKRASDPGKWAGVSVHLKAIVQVKSIIRNSLIFREAARRDILDSTRSVILSEGVVREADDNAVEGSHTRTR
jgi:hypothetical protein